MNRLRIRFAKEKELKFISHLDLLRTFVRATRRAGIPMAYSEGFSQKPRMIFAVPLPLGATSTGEYCDFFLQNDMPPAYFQAVLAKELPQGLRLLKTFSVSADAPPLPAIIEAALYSYLWPDKLPDEWPAIIEDLMARPEIKVLRNKGKDKVKEVDIRPFIFSLKVRENKDTSSLEMLLATGSRGGAKPAEILSFLECEGKYPLYLHRHSLYVRQDGLFKEPEELNTPQKREGNAHWIKK